MLDVMHRVLFGRHVRLTIRRSVFGPAAGHLAVFAIAFTIAYRFGMSFTQALSAPFWFPDSVLLCALLASPPGFWWRFALVSLPIRFLLFVPPGTPLWFLAVCFVNDSVKA